MKEPNKKMRIAVGSDHVALPLKIAVIEYLKSQNIEVVDVGTSSEKIAVDYPDYAHLVAQQVLSGKVDSGIAICGTGIGMSIASNKVNGIRAGLCHDSYSAHQARAHNNANVLCMGAWVVSPQRVGWILDEWITTAYEHGRHQQRLLKLEHPSVNLESNDQKKPKRSQIRFSVALSPSESVFGPLLFAGHLEEGLEKAAQIGFDGVELSLRDPAQISVIELKDQLSRHQLELSAIATGQSCLHDALCLGSSKRENVQGVVKRLKQHIDLASNFDAAVIIGGIRGGFSGSKTEMEKQRGWAVSALHECGQKAQEKQVQLLIEPINRYETNFLNSAEEAINFIEEAGHPEIKLLLDTFHMNLEEVNINETIKRFSERIGYLHFADSNRKAPGWGHIPFGQIMSTLFDLNYAGVIGAEILPLPDDQHAIQQAGAFFRSLISTMD